jgi:hypothetical protein
MSNSRKLAAGLALLGACAAVGIIGCESVPLTAAPGTSMTLIANPTFVISNGGVSVITAILVEPAGTFVPDGTTVFFFTDLGRVDSSGQTVNGVARVNFVADSRSGEAHVTAISGGPAPAASPSTGAGTGTGSASVTIAIGGALPSSVQVAANPQRITNPRQSTIIATVFDQFGNPVQNIPVSFSISGALIEETLASGGSPVYTDSNGQARDTLYTRAPAGGIQKTVDVTASTPKSGVNGTVTVFID